MNNNEESVFKNKKVQTASIIFLILVVWRTFIFIYPSESLSFAWGSLYQIIAIYGAYLGFTLAKSWGGHKSVLGRTILAFSWGLALQVFGQSVSSYFVYTTGTVPYPSLGDLGFFGSIPLYVYGVYLIAKLSGVNITLRAFWRRCIAGIIIIGILAASYYIFLSGYTPSVASPLAEFLDYGYPLGQALYIGIAIVSLIFIAARNSLGGVMKRPILIFLSALVMQYISDFTFLYQTSKGLYIPEGINDCMYFLSYFLMTISIIHLSIVFDRLKISK
jgi:hypothetical protein